MDSSPPEAAQPSATQKPQGGFPFLTAFDDTIILLNYRNYKEYNALRFPMLMPQLSGAFRATHDTATLHRK